MGFRVTLEVCLHQEDILYFKYKMDLSVRELKVDIIQKYVFLNTIVELGDHNERRYRCHVQ